MNFFLLSLILIFSINHCDIIRGCESKCKNRTKNCFLQNQVFRVTSTTALTGGGGSNTGFTFNINEVEPNDTFQQNFLNPENSMSISNNETTNFNATISSAIDKDIIFGGLNTNTHFINITQTNNLDKVNCNVYEKLTTSSRIQTNSSTLDASYTDKGKLNPTYTLSTNGGSFYLICTGTAGTSYTLRGTSTDSGVTGNSPASTSNFISNYSNLTSLANCPNATKDCEKTCGRGK